MSLQLTQSAADKLKSLLSEEENSNMKLRIFVSGGGCSGFQYGFAFDDNQDERDQVVSAFGVDVLVDPVSMAYLQGSVVDFVEDLNGAQFVIKNPNAASSCGCGQSFTPKDDTGGCAHSTGH